MRNTGQTICANLCHLWRNTCFVTVSNRTNYIPAHEVTHILWDTEDHMKDLPWNLMYPSIPLFIDPHGKDPRANKRLTQEQVHTMRQHTKLQ